MPETYHITVESTETGIRLDKFLTDKLEGFSRSRVQALLESGNIILDNQPAMDASAKTKAGQQFTVTIPDVQVSHIIPQDIPLNIVYEDRDILILNKPAGLTVHPAPGHPDSTLVNALLAHCGDSLSGIGGVARPGIVHRIDKETSGLLAVAKNDAAHAALSEQLATRTMKRTYVALVWGIPKNKQGTITGNIGRSFSNRKKMAVVKIGGKPAVTHYSVTTRFVHANISQVECHLETGRTHQIRVHFSYSGYPLIGDPVYGGTTTSRIKSLHLRSELKEQLLGFHRQALHAAALGLVHPTTGKAMQFTCELPEDMQALITTLTS